MSRFWRFVATWWTLLTDAWWETFLTAWEAIDDALEEHRAYHARCVRLGMPVPPSVPTAAGYFPTGGGLWDESDFAPVSPPANADWD